MTRGGTPKLLWTRNSRLEVRHTLINMEVQNKIGGTKEEHALIWAHPARPITDDTEIWPDPCQYTTDPHSSARNRRQS